MLNPFWDSRFPFNMATFWHSPTKLELILKSTDPETVQEETDSPAVVVAAEPLNVRRGGRGRGRKGVTAKETVQVHHCFMVY